MSASSSRLTESEKELLAEADREIAELKALVRDLAQHAKDGMVYYCSKCEELFRRAEEVE